MTAQKLSAILAKYGPAAVIKFADSTGAQKDINYVKRVLVNDVEVVVISETQQL